MTKKLIWGLTFVLGAPALIIWSFLLLTAATPTSPKTPYPQVLSSQAIIASSEQMVSEIRPSYTTADAREAILKKYLARFESPLLPYTRHLIEVSDKYALDYRLLVAIARQESGLCKVIPVDSYNCWGYGIYGDKVTRFDSYAHGIEIVARGLKTNYIDKGLTTPEAIMAKYTPPSLAIGGPWAKGVNQFLAEME